MHFIFQGDVAYLKDHWCQFDASMVFFLWVSVLLQMFELTAIVPRYSYLSILRAPRPLIMIRFLRVFLKFSMPKSRINQIFKSVKASCPTGLYKYTLWEKFQLLHFSNIFFYYFAGDPVNRFTMLHYSFYSSCRCTVYLVYSFLESWHITVCGTLQSQSKYHCK